MSLTMTVSPDFSPDHISDWYIFNTCLQRRLDTGIHLELYSGFDEQRKAIANDEIDLIYANPFDAAMLVREKGFSAVARPGGKADEAIVAVSEDSDINDVEELSPGITVVSAEDPEVHLMGMIMLEPADLTRDNIELKQVQNYVLVAKELFRGQADVGFFLAEAYQDLSRMVRSRLRPLIESQISVIHHSLLVGPRLAGRREEIQQRLVEMSEDEKGRGVLDTLGFDAWEPIEQEDTEFMIDLMDTLGA